MRSSTSVLNIDNASRYKEENEKLKHDYLQVIEENKSQAEEIEKLKEIVMRSRQKSLVSDSSEKQEQDNSSTVVNVNHIDFPPDLTSPYSTCEEVAGIHFDQLLSP